MTSPHGTRIKICAAVVDRPQIRAVPTSSCNHENQGTVFCDVPQVFSVNSVTLDHRNHGAVGPPHHVRRIGGDRAVVIAGRRAAMRGEQAVLAHDPQHAGPADPDAVDHPQPGPHLAVSLAGPRRAGKIPADGALRHFPFSCWAGSRLLDKTVSSGTHAIVS
jgi:hypothetical protein